MSKNRIQDQSKFCLISESKLRVCYISDVPGVMYYLKLLLNLIKTGRCFGKKNNIFNQSIYSALHKIIVTNNI